MARVAHVTEHPYPNTRTPGWAPPSGQVATVRSETAPGWRFAWSVLVRAPRPLLVLGFLSWLRAVVPRRWVLHCVAGCCTLLSPAGSPALLGGFVGPGLPPSRAALSGERGGWPIL